MPALLSYDEITSALAELDVCEHTDDTIHKTWETQGFQRRGAVANVLAYGANQA